MNRIDDPDAEGVAEEVEELVCRLRCSPETVNTLESTHYAVVRTLLDGGHTSVLMQLLTQPMTYGIFPDHLTCNLLMHTFLQCKDYTAAARVASYLMLQEDFGPPLTQALALASCYHYITSEDKQPWQDYTPKVEEPKEEVKIRVKFLRNPYFDDHFDLKEPDHLVGKTLAWASPLVPGLVGRSCEVLGWALYGKWDELEAALNRMKSGKEPIAASVVSVVKCVIEGVEDLQVREQLISALAHLEAAESGVVEEDLSAVIMQLAQEAAKEAEPLDIKMQEENYCRWEKEREEEYQKQVEEYRKKKHMAEIEHKKQDLAGKEEVIFFFDNMNKLSLLLPDKRKKFYPKKSPAYPKKKRPRVVDEAYVPPEV
ncbi:28S ribosomal protein S27, mitochondrial [Portunus trituberculatus]|uniref:28S ribosomal protein S27, mitochondrial n=1 Tax=Portunus trituberculatus TaxID=210409 RepID=A0A5B7FVB7_PORTR|nr:28S ribosomal protein S27, mitochondrial [Portunus trituberculatus]